MLKELKELRLENQETKAMLKELKELRLENDYLKRSASIANYYNKSQLMHCETML